MDRKDLETIEGYDEDNDKYVLAYPQADADNVMDGYEERIKMCCTTIKNLRARIKELETALATSREEHALSVQELTRHIEAAKPKWISVKDRLPTENDILFDTYFQFVILIRYCGSFQVHQCDFATVLTKQFGGAPILAWMSLPSPTEDSPATEKEDK